MVKDQIKTWLIVTNAQHLFFFTTNSRTERAIRSWQMEVRMTKMHDAVEDNKHILLHTKTIADRQDEDARDGGEGVDKDP